ncbi:DNA cytosine methyltransferase [Pandoraea apista]|uniref:DNA cytosine methyltransferase n=1 Tax=Pandoraea apista TaxID=93218 RepID=UPI002F9407EF
MRGAYYNELDPYAANWLRNLIAAGHIAPGDVDTRDIRDVRPDDLRGFTQCHFFAGIGVWSYALRMAGWPDDRPVWTGSCPCQPFSAAGAGLGFADERHLWPHWFHLISERRPATVFGEQVASKDVDPWIDLVQDDMEALGHAFGAIAFPAASVGAPHIRDRTYWMAHASTLRRRTRQRNDDARKSDHAGSRSDGRVANAIVQQRSSRQRGCRTINDANGRHEGAAAPSGLREHRGLANSDVNRQPPGRLSIRPGRQDAPSPVESGASEDVRPSPTNGRWRDADWLLCRDGKWRPAEPGTFPLAHGAPARVGRLRAYGNAINAEAAIEFIRCADEAIKEIA